jgi:2-hydroxy-6-oxonona-2,4-dienedioate hydrolase
MKAEYVNVNGIRTRYLRGGSADGVLLLIHGFGFSADAWVKVLDPFAERFSVFAPDFLGHGFTDWVDPGEKPALLFMADHLCRFMDAVGIKRCAAIGSSLGGVLTPLMYFQHPDRFTSLVLDAIHIPISDTGTLSADSMRGTIQNGTKAMSNATWEACINRMANICFDPKTAVGAAEIAMIQSTIYAQPDRLEAYTKIGQSCAANADNDQLRIRPERITVPTLFLSGRQDIRASIQIIEANYRRVKGAKLAVFENCGHLPEIEYPEKFVTTVCDFLGA